MTTSFEFISFVFAGDTGKTTKWNCIHKDDGFNLGQVKWFGRWRQYTFFPTNDTVFSSGCLGDIQLFIDGLMRERKRARLVSTGGPGAIQEAYPLTARVKSL